MNTSGRSILKNLNILFVEDDEHTLDAISMIFRDVLGSFSLASNCEEGIRVFHETKPDVIVTDILLPGNSGLDFVAEIRKTDKDIPVVVISGLDSADIFYESIEVQVNKYFHKPVNMKKLLDYLCDMGSEIAEKKAAENMQKTVQTLLDFSHHFYIVTQHGDITYANKTFLDYLGYFDVESFTSCKSSECEIQIIKNYEDEKETPFFEWLSEVESYDKFETVVSIIRPGVLKSDAKSYIARINQFPEEDKSVISFVDVTIIEQEKRFFHNLAHKDPLTGICNRIKFFDELARESSRSERYGAVFSVIMFDIDKFKLINDTYGHQVGDIILKELSGIVSESIRLTDIFARYGGEEFIILAPGVDCDGAACLAEKLRQRIENHNFQFAKKVTCSFGVAQHFGKIAEDTVRFADEALYKAKRTGRNKVVSH
jgi:diguanylate cyclase (GGDEF)-like protein